MVGVVVGMCCEANREVELEQETSERLGVI